MHRPVMSGSGLYDPTTIMNADQLSRAQREGWVKLAFYLLSFFYYLYRCVSPVRSNTLPKVVTAYAVKYFSLISSTGSIETMYVPLWSGLFISIVVKTVIKKL